MNKHKRMNFELSDGTITACFDNHEKGQPCEYEVLAPRVALELIEDMRSDLCKLEGAVRRFKDNPITANKHALFELLNA